MNVHCNCSLFLGHVPYVAPCTLNKYTLSVSFIELYRYKTVAWSISFNFQFMFVVLFALEKRTNIFKKISSEILLLELINLSKMPNTAAFK
jgi:hypothetical protein